MATSGDEVSCDNAITKSNFLESECLAAKSSLKDVKQLNRDQKRRARQLIVAVMAKLQEKEAFIERIQAQHQKELALVGRQLLCLKSGLCKEKNRLNRLIQEKDEKLHRQAKEIELLKRSGAVGSGSFRQARREKSITSFSNSEQKGISSDSSGNASLSSEESCSAGSTPKSGRSTLRLTLSNGTICDTEPKRGILKSSSLSHSENELNRHKTLMGNLEKLISSSTNLTPKVEDKNDSGRESDEQRSPSSRQRAVWSSPAPVVRDNSNNRSFDGNESGFDAVTFSSGRVCRLSIRSVPKVIKKKPCPPPRSSTTKLTHPPDRKPPMTVTIGDTKPEKKVTFNEEAVRVSIEKRAIHLLDQSIKQASGDKTSKSSRFAENVTKVPKRDISYVEPYI